MALPRRLRNAPFHLVAALSFGFAQPILSVLQSNAPLVIARRAGPWQLSLFALCLVLLPALVAHVLVRAVAQTRPVWAEHLHDVCVASGFALLVPQLFGRIWHIPTFLAALSWAVSSVALFVLYRRSVALRQIAQLLSVGPVVFVGSFLFSEPLVRLWGTAPSAARTGVVQASAPIVWINFDALPLASLLDGQGDINASRFPGFARLAQHATWHRRASAVHVNTLGAMPSILSGLAPDRFRLPTSREWPNTLFTWLGNRYTLHVDEPVTHLCPAALCGGTEHREYEWRSVARLLRDSLRIFPRVLAPAAFAADTADMNDPFHEFTPDEVLPTTVKAAQAEVMAALHRQGRVERFLDFVSQIGPEDRQLHFAHVLLPHAPVSEMPGGWHYPPAELRGQTNETWTGDPWYALQAEQRHMLQLRRTDELLTALIDRMEALALWDRALLVVTADHGISFEPGTYRRSITEENAYQIAAVPLFIKAPGQTSSAISDAPILVAEILPHVATLLGEQLPWTPTARRYLRWSVDDGEESLVELEDTFDLRVVIGGERAQRFETRDSALDLFAIGPLRELVGLRLGELPKASPAAVQVELKGIEALAHMDTRQRQAPGIVEGRLRGPDADRLDAVAIALNGTIVTSAPVLAEESQRLFTALLPSSFLVDGFNRLELLARDTAGGAALRPLRLELEDGYELASEQEIRTTDGERITIEPDAIRGYIDSAGPNGSLVNVSGWAVDLKGKQPVDVVLVFADDRYAHVSKPTIERPGIVEMFSTPAVLMSGWAKSVPAPAKPGAIRAFGVSGSRATELVVLDSAREAISHAR